jgi:hypothetical protein
MKPDQRKAAVAAYKERKSIAGIFAVRCTGLAEVWVGKAPNIDTVRTRLWFALGLGTSPHRALQAAWATHGGDAFAFEILEKLEPDDDATAYVASARLKDRLEHWRVKLNAQLL